MLVTFDADHGCYQIPQIMGKTPSVGPGCYLSVAVASQHLTRELLRQLREVKQECGTTNLGEISHPEAIETLFLRFPSFLLVFRPLLSAFPFPLSAFGSGYNQGCHTQSTTKTRPGPREAVGCRLVGLGNFVWRVMAQPATGRIQGCEARTNFDSDDVGVFGKAGNGEGPDTMCRKSGLVSLTKAAISADNRNNPKS
jgi:hypothetical protein